MMKHTIVLCLVQIAGGSLMCSDVKTHYQTSQCCSESADTTIQDTTLFRTPATDAPSSSLGPEDILTDLIYTSYGITLGRLPTALEYDNKRDDLLSGTLSGNELDRQLVNTAEHDALRGFAHQSDDLSSSYVICVGCSSGTGLWTAMRLARMGASVYACARTQSVWDANMHRALETPSGGATSLNPQGQTQATVDLLHFKVADARNASSIQEVVRWALASETGSGRKLLGGIVAWPGHPYSSASGEFYDEPSWKDDLAATGPDAGGRFAPLNFNTANVDRFNSPWNSQGIGTIKAIQQLLPTLREHNASLVLTCTSDGWLTGSELGEGTSTGGAISTGGGIPTGGKFGYGSGVYATVGKMTLIQTAQEAASSGVSTRVVALGVLNTDRNAVGLLTYNPEPTMAGNAEADGRCFWSYSVDPATLDIFRSDVYLLNMFPYLWTPSFGGATLATASGPFDMLPGAPKCDALNTTAFLCGYGVLGALSQAEDNATALDGAGVSVPTPCLQICTTYAECAPIAPILSATPQDCTTGPPNPVARHIPYRMFGFLLHIMRQLVRSGANPIYGNVDQASGSPTAFHVDGASKAVVEALLNPEMENTYLSHNNLQKASTLGVTLKGHLHDQKTVAWNYERFVQAGISHFTGRPVDSATLGRPAWRVRMF